MKAKKSDAHEGIVLQSSDGKHRCKIYVRSDGRLAAVKLRRDEKGEWSTPPSGQGEEVLAAWHGVTW